MPNSCSVCPWLVSPLVLSSHRTLTVSYLHLVIPFPKKLPRTDWTMQSRVQVVSTHLPRCTHLQSRCAPVSYGRPCPELGFWGGVSYRSPWSSGQAGWRLAMVVESSARGKGKPGYPGPCEAVLPSLKETESSHVRVCTRVKTPVRACVPVYILVLY